jgi:hypothetical protein
VSGQDNRLKTPLALSINQAAGQRAADASQAIMKGIPATVVSRIGQFVTVKFAMQIGGPNGVWTLTQAAYPIGGGSPNDWYPYDAGTNGLLLPSNFYLGGITGQGGGVSDYSQRGNLSALAFFPLPGTNQSKDSQAPGGDTDKRCATGPNGTYFGSDDGSVSITVDKASKTVTISAAGKTWTFGPNGFTDSNSVIEETHEHTGVTTGSDKSGGPVNP